MTSFRLALIAAFVLGITVVAGLSYCTAAHNDDVSQAIEQEGVHRDTAERILLAERRSADSARRSIEDSIRSLAALTQRYQRVQASADSAARTIASIRDTSLAPADGVTVSDTTAMSVVDRAGDPKPYLVPRFFAQAAVRWHVQALTADSANQRLSTDLVLAQAALALSRHERAGADSVNASLKRTIALQNERKAPWCGDKCGFVFGVATTIGAAIALHHVQQSLGMH